MIDAKELAEKVMEAANLSPDESVFSFDSEHWTDEEIRSFIDIARGLGHGKLVKLKGIRVGEEAFIRLGGAQGTFVNARFEKDIPVVQIPTMHPRWVELVFRP
jgi:hypothetical protein